MQNFIALVIFATVLTIKLDGPPRSRMQLGTFKHRVFMQSNDNQNKVQLRVVRTEPFKLINVSSNPSAQKSFVIQDKRIFFHIKCCFLYTPYVQGVPKELPFEKLLFENCTPHWYANSCLVRG